MRIVFMGTPEFALPGLDILLQNGYPVVGVVTVPDKPSGRGRELTEPAVKRFARERNLPVLQPANLKDPAFLREMRELSPDLFVVVAFRILPRELYTIPPRGAFNLHASLLPRYRGAAPINWAIIRGEKETGVTTFFLEDSVDTGSVILQARVPIGENETAGELHDRLMEIGAEIILHSVRLIERNAVVSRKQADGDATPAPKIFREDCRIDWTKPAREVHNFIRGLSPKPCAVTSHEGSELKIYITRCADESAPGVAGSVLETAPAIRIQCGRGAVDILELQQSGRRRMPCGEFLRGYRLSIGTILR
ncbi:MAG TPA: methionyl-tRNA formyltransferase [Bacteroidota bacterium]|nr:methionyl-tRNA formyltransferase [Bacteroidota bacterium]